LAHGLPLRALLEGVPSPGRRTLGAAPGTLPATSAPAVYDPWSNWVQPRYPPDDKDKLVTGLDAQRFRTGLEW
jgi:hypothetical protein